MVECPKWYLFPASTINTRKLYDLPKFFGRPEEWPAFYIAFIHRIIHSFWICSTWKLSVSKNIWKAAREEVECLLIDPNNVMYVINQLKNIYDREIMPITEIISIC